MENLPRLHHGHHVDGIEENLAASMRNLFQQNFEFIINNFFSICNECPRDDAEEEAELSSETTKEENVKLSVFKLIIIRIES